MTAPPAVGDTVWDAARDRVGQVMGHVGPRVQLRPLCGGVEWEAALNDLLPATLTDPPGGDA
ncbi:hypothetical protein [Streptomyces luteolus]|uniref:Uncharacterized protein n=1 Tax=Streptomyces luteolus TaxID=3043615 RepID=A0ABT6T7C9_9ACTN|nr:hypothetical protein [Streptomyces sp. B-S-A12]MDI3423719.1 hypothetical protein [Streptomyces sp. B-S-A12]